MPVDTAQGVEETEPYQYDLTANARGWLIDPHFDGRRINVNVNGLPEHRLFTKDGIAIEHKGEYLYYFDETGEPVEVGNRWTTGIGVQYALNSGGYEIQIDNVNVAGERDEREVILSYMDHGYYDMFLKYSEFDDYSSCKIVIEPYESMGIEMTGCELETGLQKVMPPSHLYSEEELAVINQD